MPTRENYTLKLYDSISRALRGVKRLLFCCDNVNVSEFNRTVMEGIHMKHQTVIPVLLETVDPENLHEEMYVLLKIDPVPIYCCGMNLLTDTCQTKQGTNTI